jgi:ParB-like chromosome segregation protein Spo0J
MAKTKTDPTKLALQRLALDEEVQEHLGNAVVQLREAWRRAAHRPPARAVEDKQIYARIRQAAISLARAVKLLAPEPEPPKRRGRKLVAAMLVAGGASALLMKRRRASADEPADPQPAATPKPVATAESQPNAAA